ncbi:MAG: polyhydroxyalkanoate synthesis repressor PhaR [Geminicoccaceae bacterium]
MTSARNPDEPGRDEQVTVVKKYANRRLYNTGSSSYVTLEELAQLIRNGQNFVVFDAKSGEDITRSVLTQIILEEDAKGRNLLPTNFLRRLIGYYDHNLHAFVPRYLEMSLDHFAQNQEQIRRYFEGTMGQFFPVNQLEDMTRKNMALFQQAASMFSPFKPPVAGTGEIGADPDRETGIEPSSSDEASIEALQQKVEALQKQLDELVQEKSAAADAGSARKRKTS